MGDPRTGDDEGLVRGGEVVELGLTGLGLALVVVALAVWFLPLAVARLGPWAEGMSLWLLAGLVMLARKLLLARFGRFWWSPL